MTARASGSLKPVRCNVSFHHSTVAQRSIGSDAGHCTGQIQEVGILVELVEDGTRAVLDIGGGEHSDGAFGQGFGKFHAAVVVFLCGDSRRDCSAS